MMILALIIGFVIGFFFAIVAMCLIDDYEEKKDEKEHFNEWGD